MATVRELRIAQFTDLHLLDSHLGEGDFQILRDALTQAIEQWEVQIILATGDLVQRGNTSAYAQLRALFDALPVPVVPAIGNHDDRTAFLEAMPSFSGSTPPAEPGGVPFAGVVRHGDTEFIVLDSNVADDGNGRLSQTQLQWLEEHLGRTDAGDSVVVVHHPVFTSPLRTLNRPLTRGVPELERAITESTVRAVLSGHYHHAGASVLGSAVAWAAPAFCWETDLSSTDVPRRLNRRNWTLVRLAEHRADCVPIQIGES